MREPFATEPGFFRLITLFPGRWEDEISCKLGCYNRLRFPFPSYKALSYVWGRGGKIPPEILVNDKKVKVTRNLETALRYLRDQEEEKTLWIDALCIDQSDIAERSLQVAQMRDVYNTASEVIIFLGNTIDYGSRKSHSYHDPRPYKEFGIGDADVSLANQYLDTWKTSSLKHPVQALEVFSFLTIIARYGFCSDILRLLEGFSQAHITAFFEALRRTLLAPWWSRIWVVQEAVVARKLTVRCNNVAISWELLDKVASDLSQWESTYTKNPSSISTNDLKVFNLLSRVIDLNHFRKNWKASQGTDLLSLLRYFGHRNASDDRDRVYGLLGLCNEATVVRPDYRLEVEQVYLMPILEAIRNTKSLSVLYGDHSRKGRRDLPSWVPDWGTALDENDRQRASIAALYDACGGTTLIEFTMTHTARQAINQQMVEFLNSLKVEREPKRLLREELVLKLRSSSIQSTDPEMQLSKRICEDLAEYCHKDGLRDLPKYAPIYCHGKRLRVFARLIGTVHRVTEPLFTTSDMNTVTKVLFDWKDLVISKEHIENARECFLKTIVSDFKKTPDGRLQRLQQGDMALLSDWFDEKIAQRGLNNARQEYGSVGAEFDGFMEAMRLSTTKRTLFLFEGSSGRSPNLEHGQVGIGPMLMKEGDLVCILPGSNLPLILRSDGRRKQLIGDCFVHGIMDGEAGAMGASILDYLDQRETTIRGPTHTLSYSEYMYFSMFKNCMFDFSKNTKNPWSSKWLDVTIV